ncbi:hypothetical protein [Actinophytocola oryzae]|uniref:Uncharacterized protein n=1 Tax=Actinophytocola oryzae TaxID=502181 RepID=A0A4R7UVN8_9PSEU|nr:hypothetical protein [Actinophytocola oryzae]TDV40114.1 hypothetical protein CLV71_124133 [Actinophytocola oryzae]
MAVPARAPALASAPGRIVCKEPLTVWYEGTLWLTCPVEGWNCARIERFGTGTTEEWAQDVMDVHVDVRHKRWT